MMNKMKMPIIYIKCVRQSENMSVKGLTSIQKMFKLKSKLCASSHQTGLNNEQFWPLNSMNKPILQVLHEVHFKKYNTFNTDEYNVLIQVANSL